MRSTGRSDVKLVEETNAFRNIWRIRWDVTHDKEYPGIASYMEHRFEHKPTLDEIKEVIIDWINDVVDQRIQNGFVWRDMPVWLSMENQFNYKAAYDLAVQNPEIGLPVKFKFGTVEEPQYHLFETMEDLSDFYLKSVAYVQDTLSKGWEEKDNFDFKVYSDLL